MKLNKQTFALLIGLIGLITPLLLPLEGLNMAGQITFGIFIMAAVFWLLEPIPIFATSVLIILLQVFFLSGQGLLGDYLGQIEGYSPQSFRDFYGTLASPIIILFLGGFSLAAASVKYGLDRNLTRWLLKPFGSRSQYVCLGLMVATATLSAFMSNTATTAMMITVVIPIIGQLDAGDPFRKVVALCIPFAANIGGIATPIGTPPNAIALAALREQGVQITFSTWMLVAVPLVAIMLLVAWRLLLWFFPPATEQFEVKFEGTLDKSPAAIGTYCVFGLTVLLWVTEKLHGISSTVVAFIPIALLPALSVLDKRDIRGFSWEVLWLVAGGISLGLSLEQTGLAAWLVDLVNWGAFNGFALFFVFSGVSFVAALLISHTVSATILIPLAAGLAVSTAAALDFNLTILILIIAVTVSFGMVLPISTPPNAIAMSTGLIETRDMARSGIVIGLCGFAATLAFGIFYFPLFF